jgi:hypothetical protein
MIEVLIQYWPDVRESLAGRRAAQGGQGLQSLILLNLILLNFVG